MATALSVVVFILSVTVVPLVSAGDDCQAYTDGKSKFHYSQDCDYGYSCCGTCTKRYCCSNVYSRLTESEQEECFSGNYEDISTMAIASSVAVLVGLLLLFICCCVCPCCCLYKMCRRPTPVIATTTTHTTVTTQFPQQPVASPSHAYQAAQYPGYHPVPVQPGYGAQPMPTAPYQGQPYMPGPPPPYQEAGAYAPVPYSQAAFTPGHSPYPLQPPAQPGQLPTQTDHHSSQPAYNPSYVAHQPPKMGY